MKNLTIGLLAHNEANVIGRVLEDVARQSVMEPGFSGLSVTIYVVPNGCTDDTAAQSRKILGQMDLPDHVAWDVTVVEKPSKTNAWNVFVHEIAPENSDYLLFLDADIRLTQTDIIEKTVATLDAHPDAWAASDRVVNVFPEDAPPSLMKLASRVVAKTASGGDHSICGQFYCARAEKLRQITLPVGFLSQDGFIAAMIVTSALCEPADHSRIQNVPNAFHLHPAYQKLSQRFRYEKRQAMSTTVYTFVYDMMVKMPASMSARMETIRHLNQTDPDWVMHVVEERCAGRFFIVPRSYVFKRFKKWNSAQRRSWAKAPLVLAATIFDIWVGLRASQELRTQAIGSVDKNDNRFKIRAGQ